jgi:twinkle protein
MNLDDYRLTDKNTYLFKPEHCIEQMLIELKTGKVRGSTTHNNDLDTSWTWRKEEANIWTGYANEGKSLFLKQICLIKALEDNWTFLFCSPEDFPPQEFYDDLIHTLAGKTTDKFYQKNLISKELYQHCYKLIKDRFLFLYVEPPHNTIKGTLEEFKKLCKEQTIDACIIDPLLKFARPKDFSERDDIYACYIGSICVDFARQTNTSFHLVMHQLTPNMDRDDKRYAEPSMYRIKGGGSWADGFDNVLSVWRPEYAIDKTDTNVQFSSQKIKKQKLVGIPSKFKMEFNRKTNRYEKDGKAIFNFDKFLM